MLFLQASFQVMSQWRESLMVLCTLKQSIIVRFIQTTNGDKQNFYIVVWILSTSGSTSVPLFFDVLPPQAVESLVGTQTKAHK